MAENGHMTKAERDELAKLVRRREKVAKAAAAQRSAELMANFEAQLASRYSFDDDEVWRQARDAADEAARQADALIAERCAALGIPERFRPSMGVQWYSRGENAAAQRRAELRQVAKTRLDALEKSAKVEIERRSVDVQTMLVAGGLESETARAFLESMPTVEALMPVLSVAEIESATAAGLPAAR